MADPYSMVGTLYDTAGANWDTVEGRFNDQLRRGHASKISDLLLKNPSFNKKVDRYSAKFGYGGVLPELPFDQEGLLTAYAQKYGQASALKMLEAMPYMSEQDLMGVVKDVYSAASEYDDMNRRERMTYERSARR